MGMSNVEWWDPPRKIMIKLEPHQISPNPQDGNTVPLGHDTFIVMEFRGRQFDALIPTSTLVDNKYVPATLAGRNGDKTIVYFPISNEGRPTWLLTDAELESITA